MPRPIDLRDAPPAEATCHACQSTVQLDRRARSRGRFRCPVCHSDNRVGADGIGRPLRGQAEHPAHMPRTRCNRCGTTNRLPAHLIKRGAYRCRHCHTVGRVPRTFRRRALGEGAWIAGLLVIVAVAVGVGVFRTTVALRQISLLLGATLADVESTLVIHHAGPVGIDARGVQVQITGEITNALPQPASLYIVGEVRQNEQPVASQTVSLLRMRPGERRGFEVRLITPRDRPGDQVGLFLLGAS